MRQFPWKNLLAAALVWGGVLALLQTCDNNPWEDGAAAQNTLFTTISSEIRSLDPAASNYTHEFAILDNVVEAPLAYHYLKRPYTLLPMLLEELPVPVFYDQEGRVLPGDPPPEQVARTEYTLRLRPGISYQPHPCFHPESRPLAERPGSPWDFGPVASREVTAQDFQTSLVRLCDPRSGCTVFGQLDTFLLGLGETREAVAREIQVLDQKRREAGESPEELEAFPSLPEYHQIPCPAIRILDRYTFQYTLSRKYPQFLYWLAMHYFAPVPREALVFFQRPEAREAGLRFANWPVGCGPFLLKECDLNFRIVLERNPLYHDFRYPEEGTPEDVREGRLQDAGQRLPFLDQVIFHWEPESLPAWTKFTQGYYDFSGLPADMFDQALSLPPGGGELGLSPEMAERGISMTTSVPPITYYYAFNFRDPVVGGLGERQRLLRQAISIVLDSSQFIQIFRNGNGVPAESIIPPGIFGAANPPEGLNHFVNQWDGQHSRRLALAEARQRLAQAGYPGGVDQKTGNPLVLYLDHAAAGQPDFKSRFRWLQDHLGQLGIRLEERGFDLNRSRQRISQGNWQFLYGRGWVGDYPDPENFLMLYASRNGHVEYHGPNYANYSNPEYDRCFQTLETMEDSPERLALIRQATEILARDAPVVWDFHPRNLALVHPWLHNFQPQTIAYDTLKYLRLEPERRTRCQREWNRPRKWPVLALLALFTIPLLLPRRRRQSAP